MVLSQYDGYMEVFDPVWNKEAIYASLSDDLADIYLDLYNPLINFDNSRIITAVWEWKFGIIGHIGDHLVDVLRPIHRLVFKYLSED